MSPNSFAEFALSYLLHSTWCFAVAHAIRPFISPNGQRRLWTFAAFTGLVGSTLPWLAKKQLLSNLFGFSPWSLNSVYQPTVVPSLDLKFCLASLLSWIWIAGTVWSICMLVVAMLRTQLSLSERKRTQDPRVLRLVGKAKCQMGMSRNIIVTECEPIHSPLALGIREICLPLGVAQELNDVELTAVFGHELTHLRRGDPIAVFLLETFSCLLWFQPLWRNYLNQRLQFIEEECDQRGATLCGKAEDMAKVLVKLARRSQLDPTMVSLSSPRAPLTARVSRLVSNQTHPPKTLPWGVLLASIAMIALVFCAPAITMELELGRHGDQADLQQQMTPMSVSTRS